MLHQHVARNLKWDVKRIEQLSNVSRRFAGEQGNTYQQRRVEAIIHTQLQLLLHTLNPCIANVNAIKVREHVEQKHDGKDAKVNLPHQCLVRHAISIMARRVGVRGVYDLGIDVVFLFHCAVLFHINTMQLNEKNC